MSNTAVMPAFDAGAAVDVSVVAVSYNTASLLGKMWDALKRSGDHIKLEMIVVDNASRDDSAQLLRNDPDFSGFKTIENKVNVGFGRANNQGVACASGRYILLLNTDAFVSPDTLEKVLAYMDSHPQCGVLGTRLTGRDGDQQPNCRFFPTIWNLFLSRAGLSKLFPWVRMIDLPAEKRDVRTPTECDWVTGCFMMIRREVVEATGLFDRRYFLYFEEVDFCVSAKKLGWKIVYLPTTDVIHLGGESAKSDATLTEAGKQISVLQIESELLYVRKHFGRSGLLAHLCLCRLADLIRALRFLKNRNAPGLTALRQDAANRQRLLRETKWGTTPTR
jgi:N-acetylglucosaminyl-diphospho-decaprenol L-rhamnosyltransferase